MINIDKQCVATARKLEALGYRYRPGEWVQAFTVPAPLTAESDAMHAR